MLQTVDTENLTKVGDRELFNPIQRELGNVEIIFEVTGSLRNSFRSSEKNKTLHEKLSEMKNRKVILKNDYPLRIWQRIVLLVILGYEAAGALSGGSLLVASPDGRLMNMSISIMNGFFPDFLIPGIMLIGLGILNLAAFVAVLRRSQIDWLLTGLALGGLAIWFITEIIILQGFHWLHAMWGLPVLVGCLVAFPMVSYHLSNHYLKPV